MSNRTKNLWESDLMRTGGLKLARHWCPLDDRLTSARISLFTCLCYSTLVDYR
jgi:hypothetical protein